MIQQSSLILSTLVIGVLAAPLMPRDDDAPKKDDSFFLSFISACLFSKLTDIQTILITILAAAILVVFYRYAVKYIPSDTIRIPLKVFSRVSPDGMIRLPTSDEEAAHMGETFPDDNSDEHAVDPNRFRDEDDDDIPPPVTPANNRKVATTQNEEDVFDVVSEDEDEVPAGQESDWNKAWRD